jgi:hypothetical protein
MEIMIGRSVDPHPSGRFYRFSHIHTEVLIFTVEFFCRKRHWSAPSSGGDRLPFNYVNLGWKRWFDKVMPTIGLYSKIARKGSFAWPRETFERGREVYSLSRCTLQYRSSPNGGEPVQLTK